MPNPMAGILQLTHPSSAEKTKKATKKQGIRPTPWLGCRSALPSVRFIVRSPKSVNLASLTPLGTSTQVPNIAWLIIPPGGGRGLGCLDGTCSLIKRTALARDVSCLRDFLLGLMLPILAPVSHFQMALSAQMEKCSLDSSSLISSDLEKRSLNTHAEASAVLVERLKKSEIAVGRTEVTDGSWYLLSSAPVSLLYKFSENRRWFRSLFLHGITICLQYVQLIEEAKEEKFEEGRVNLLKAPLMQLDRQVILLAEGLSSQICSSPRSSNTEIKVEALEVKLEFHRSLYSLQVRTIEELVQGIRKAYQAFQENIAQCGMQSDKSSRIKWRSAAERYSASFLPEHFLERVIESTCRPQTCNSRHQLFLLRTNHIIRMLLFDVLLCYKDLRRTVSDAALHRFLSAFKSNLAQIREAVEAFSPSKSEGDAGGSLIGQRFSFVFCFLSPDLCMSVNPRTCPSTCLSHKQEQQQAIQTPHVLQAQRKEVSKETAQLQAACPSPKTKSPAAQSASAGKATAAPKEPITAGTEQRNQAVGLCPQKKLGSRESKRLEEEFFQEQEQEGSRQT
ncbi:hypothetical protein Baya_8189 [Bagarius yarrelli]|uniref:Uncharacterized protein n=1 Tax=Bagarius yarrelli TaxID=175774 RepID=A0A556U5F9_BAGYA|nr:hypothetical protein Baya_8189 [Bagarius yarrelli]